MPFDYKKEYKDIYQPSKKPALIEMPPINYVAVRGKGDPNEEDGEYQRALQMLYGISFTIKMSPKSGYDIEGYTPLSFRRWKAFGLFRSLSSDWIRSARPNSSG